MLSADNSSKCELPLIVPLHVIIVIFEKKVREVKSLSISTQISV